MAKLIKVLTLVIAVMTLCPMLCAMKKAVVLNSCPYPNMTGKIATVQGTIHEIFGIDNFWDSKEALRLPVFIKYIGALPLELLGDKGTVYYAKVGIYGFCFHESWLEIFPDEDEHKDLAQSKK